MSSDLEHWHIDAKVHDDRVEEIHLISDPARNIRRKPYITVWHVERYLGRGSFGEVRLERDRKEDKVRAVKRVATSSSSLSQKDCEQELKALLEFSKPKSKDAAIFVEFFGWFNSGFNIYLAMEYIELGDLEKNVQLHSGKLPEVEVQSIAEQILSGLEIMHKASFAHRDLKPQNVLVVIGPPQWWVKLTDFGLSKRLTDDTEYHTSAGTLPYMAPEIRNYLELAASRKYTNAVDLWAVGCMIYRLITGIVPFPQERSLIQYCDDTSFFPNDLLAKHGVKDSGSNFLRQLLAIDPKERLSAAKALQHHWIISCANIKSMPLSTSHPSLESAGLSGSAFSAIDYNTASHAGLKSYNSLTSSKTSKLSSPKSILPTASASTSCKMADVSYLIPPKSPQQSLPSYSKQIREKSPKASFNKTEAQYESQNTINRLQDDSEESVADKIPVELASNSQQSPFLGTTTDLVGFIRSKHFERGKDLFINCKYSEAEQVFQQISQRRKKVLGKEAAETLESKHWLARTLFAQKQDQEAEEVWREVVRGREKVLGTEAAETLESKHWLARTFRVQKQHQEAEAALREVVRAREKVLGTEAVETLESKYWLARTFRVQKQYQKAEEVWREVVRGREKVLGIEAVETLKSKHWLADTLYMQKLYQKAEAVWREVVRGREKVLGTEAAETLESKHWLASTLYMQKQYQKAEEVWREVVRRREKVLGTEAAETLESKYWLADAFRLQEQYQKAEEVWREVVRGREKVLGKEAAETLKSKHWLAVTLYKQEQYQKAEEVSRQVVRGREKLLGTEAAETLESKHWLAHTLHMQEQYQKAEEVWRQVVRGREKVLGTEAAETLKGKYWLGDTLYMQKQYQKAEEVLRQVVRGREKVLGAEAAETLKSKYWLANALYAQQQYQKAEEVLKEVVRGREKVLGKENPETVESRQLLSKTSEKLTLRNTALSLFQVRNRALG